MKGKMTSDSPGETNRELALVYSYQSSSNLIQAYPETSIDRVIYGTLDRNV